jgi:hypothetical protein
MKISLKFDTFIHSSELKIADLLYKGRDVNAFLLNNTTYVLEMRL